MLIKIVFTVGEHITATLQMQSKLLTERKLNRSTLSMPNALSCRMTGAKLVRCISGTVEAGSFSKSSSDERNRGNKSTERKRQRVTEKQVVEEGGLTTDYDISSHMLTIRFFSNSPTLLFSYYLSSIPGDWHIPVYSLKHFPGRFRPALPALWLAEALEMGVTTSDSMAVRGL